jgi:predicted nucleic acid-binding protein
MPTNAEPEALVDTSVAVALVAADHARHTSTLAALTGTRLGLAGHAWFETYSVLTRLPPPARRSPASIVQALRHNFPATRFLDPEAAAALGDELASRGIAGGSVYDALVGATARQHDLVLVTRDRRALAVYHALGARVEFLA